ncbi:MAG: hypothetical protein QM820_44455 [Minicystis sp.]
MFKKLGVSIAAIVLTLLLLELGFRLFYRDDTLTLDLDRELYWVPRAAQKTSTVTINGVGLRGKETAERDPAKFRVLVTGDSFTFGEKVNDDETYPAQLGALLDQEGARHPGDGRPNRDPQRRRARLGRVPDGALPAPRHPAVRAGRRAPVRHARRHRPPALQRAAARRVHEGADAAEVAP